MHSRFLNTMLDMLIFYYSRGPLAGSCLYSSPPPLPPPLNYASSMLSVLYWGLILAMLRYGATVEKKMVDPILRQKTS